MPCCMVRSHHNTGLLAVSNRRWAREVGGGPRDLVVHVDVLHKATVESLVEQLFGQHLRKAFEMDDVDCVADDVARMTAAETFVALDIVFLRSEEHTSELQSRFGISYA